MIQAIPASGTPATVPLHAIIMRPQIRTRSGFDEASLKELAETVRAQGILQPIIVARTPEDETRYHLIAGERRVLAATMAGLDEIPATIREGSPADLAAIQAVENLQRQDLHLLDIAEGIQAMKALYPKRADLARALGKSPAWLSKHERLTRLTPAVKALVSEGMADLETITTLDTLARLKTPAGMAQFLRCAKLAEADALTRQIARDALAAAKAQPAEKPADNTDNNADNESADTENDNTPSAATAEQQTGMPTLRLTREEMELVRHTLRECGDPTDPVRASALEKLDAAFRVRT